MRIVIACDSFKGSLTAREVGDAIAGGLRAVWPDAAIDNLPVADGGEGTIAAIIDALGGTRRHARVSGPLGMPVDAAWGHVPARDGHPARAIIEMATAAGLPLLRDDERDPQRATTRGVGELIRAALDAGCRHFIVTLGGSATNDGGAGMAQALGVSLRDVDDVELPPGGAPLARLARIDTAGLDPRLAACRVEVACDVDNPLAGPEGASVVFGPQKGADAATVARLDEALAQYGRLLDAQCGRPIAASPGAGAAGGLGAGLLAFAGGTLRPGAELVLDTISLAARLQDADLVITGEGRLDAQSLRGKAPIAVARLAQRHGVPAVAIVGSLGPGAEDAYRHGVAAMFSILDRPGTLAEAQADTPRLLRQCAIAVARLWTAAQGACGSRTSGTGSGPGVARYSA